MVAMDQKGWQDAAAAAAVVQENKTHLTRAALVAAAEGMEDVAAKRAKEAPQEALLSGCLS
jgi:hypothetical protein